MNDFELALKPSLLPEGASGLVPVGYAEKAMASLMQLHSEVLDEKERRVDLHRRLMEKEQALAELKWYVKLLEEKLEAAPPAVAPAQEVSRRAGACPPPNHGPAPGAAPAPPALRTAPLPPPPPAPRRDGAPVAAAPRAVPRPPAVARQAPAAHDLPPPPSPSGAMAAARPRPAQDGWKTW